MLQNSACYEGQTSKHVLKSYYRGCSQSTMKYNEKPLYNEITIWAWIFKRQNFKAINQGRIYARRLKVVLHAGRFLTTTFNATSLHKKSICVTSADIFCHNVLHNFEQTSNTYNIELQQIDCHVTRYRFFAQHIRW